MDIPANIHQTIDTLAALVRARLALSACRNPADVANFVTAMAPAEATARESLRAWATTRLRNEHGIRQGDIITVVAPGEVFSGQISDVCISLRLTDVSAIPCIEIALDAGRTTHTFVLDGQVTLQRVFTRPGLAVAA